MRLLIILPFVLLIASCDTSKMIYHDIGDNYIVEYECEGQYVPFYRLTETNKKLEGAIIRSTTGLYDSTLHFKFVSTFKKGLLTGKDSIFREGELIEVSTYENGIRHGSSEEFNDSRIIVSNYDHGVINGNQQTYSANVLIKQSNFFYGIKSGQEFNFDSLGKATFSSTYKFDSTRVVLDESKKTGNIIRKPTGDTMGIADYLRMLECKGTITVSNNLGHPGDPYYEEIFHPSIIESESCEDDLLFGYYYLVEEYGGDGIDQIWLDTWIVYKERFDVDFYYWKIENR
jgi:hypothetical protein